MSERSAELLELADRIVDRARDGEQVEAVVVHSRDTEVRVYEGEVESLSSAESQGVGVRVVEKQRQGFAYAGTLDAQAADEALDEARDNCVFGTPDPHAGLADHDGVAVADLDLWRPEVAEVPAADKVDMAAELERATKAADPRIIGVESSDYADSLVEEVIVSTNGIRAATRETACYVSVYALASDGSGTETGFGFSVGREPGELDVAKAAADAAERSTRLLGAEKPPTERVSVVLDPFVTAQFLGIVGATLSGEAVLKGRSPFADRVGEDVGSGGVTLVDDPTDEAAFSATQVDAEGLATRRNVLVDGGVLQGFLHNSYTGRRAGTVSTGSAVRGGFKTTPGVGTQALSLAPGAADQQQLIADVGDGVLIQGVSGLHSGVNPVSGDFSTGAEGLRIRGGALAEPVREFTIASTLQRMLKDILAVGGDLEWFPMSAAGVSLVIGDVTVSGT